MSADWDVLPLQSIAAESRNAIVGGPFGSDLVSKDYVDHGVPVIRGQNLSGRWISGPYAYVTEEKANALSGNLARKGDIVFTQRGTLGQISIVPESQYSQFLISQSQMKMTPDPAKADALFLYYIFRTEEYQNLIRTNAIQTGVPHINLGILRSIKVPLPPLSEQRAIAHILGTLDDKIETNRKMNETLEAMARALFKSWFVDFDPVRKKLAGQPTGLPPEIDALFPGEFEDSALGDGSTALTAGIPKGWRVGKLPESFEINPTRSLSKNMNTPYLEMSNMPTDRAREEGFVLRPFGSGMKFINGDTLIARITPCLENGKTCFVDFLKDGEVGWGSTEYIVLRSKPPLGLSMSYFLARDENFRAFAISNMTGTTGRQRVPTESLTGYEVIIPPAELCDKFEEFSSNIFKKLKATDAETRELTAIRDTLLPKLISGELRVRDASKFVETAL